MMVPKKIIHLLSGGLDSVTLLYQLKEEHHVYCLLCDYKQAHVKELECARFHCNELGIPYKTEQLPALGGLTKENWVVPFRNAILLGCAVSLAVRAGADTVTIGCNADDAAIFPDCRPEFLAAMNATVKAAGYHVEICAPFIDWPKWKIAALSRQLKVPVLTIWTCYQPRNGEPCGECLACKNLSAALQTEAEQREMRPC